MFLHLYVLFFLPACRRRAAKLYTLTIWNALVVLNMIVVVLAAAASTSMRPPRSQEAAEAASCRDKHICYKPDGTGQARYWYNKRVFPPSSLTRARKTHGECMVGCFPPEMARQMGFETCGKACPTAPPKRITLHFGRRFTCHSCYHQYNKNRNQRQQQQHEQHDLLQCNATENVASPSAALSTKACQSSQDPIML
jgi:hypothetical protein